MILQTSAHSEGYWFPLPVGWSEKPLGELFETQLGKMKGKNASVGKQFSYIKGRNLQWGDVQVDSLETMHFSESERIQYELLRGDLLVCEYGEVGRCAIWEDSVPDCYFQNHIYRIRAAGELSVEYLRYFLEYATKMPGFSRFVTQTSVQQISQSNLRSIPIPYPNSMKVRNIFSNSIIEIESLIGAEELALKKYKRIFAGVTQDRMQGLIDLGQTSTLSQLCSVITKGTTPTTDGDSYTERGVAFIRAENINQLGRINFEKVLHISNSTHRKQFRSQIMENDVLLTIAGVIGRTAHWVNYDISANCNQAVAILRCNEPSISEYIFETLHTDYMRNQMNRMSVQTAQANLSLGTIKDMMIPFPEDELLRDEIISTNQKFRLYLISQLKVISKLNKIKWGLLSDFFMEGIQ